jgi:hypothetical protein
MQKAQEYERFVGVLAQARALAWQMPGDAPESRS